MNRNAQKRVKKLANMLISALIMAIIIPLVGCSNTDPTKGYTSKSLYTDQIETIFVPMFSSQSFRREIEYDLTRVLCQQIELKTPYKIVSDRSQADSILYGQINSVTERELNQQRDLDRPLTAAIVMNVQVTWKDLRNGNLLLSNKKYRLSSDYARMIGVSDDNPTQQAATDIAIQIVEDMEMPW